MHTPQSQETFTKSHISISYINSAQNFVKKDIRKYLKHQQSAKVGCFTGWNDEIYSKMKVKTPDSKFFNL